MDGTPRIFDGCGFFCVSHTPFEKPQSVPLPGGQLPTSPLPSLVTNFVIEILSKGNTYGEMSRKRREYFHAGVELMWMVEHRNRTITVYRTSQRFEVIREGEMIDAAPVLPDWKFNTADFFAVLDQQPPTAP